MCMYLCFGVIVPTLQRFCIIVVRTLIVLSVNTLAPGKFEWNFIYIIFKQILVIDGWAISCEITLIWMPLDFTDDQSTLVQVMAWCRQATSHYLSQCWPISLLPHGVTRPQWVNWMKQIFVLFDGLLPAVSTLNKPTHGLAVRVGYHGGLISSYFHTLRH